MCLQGGKLFEGGAVDGFEPEQVADSPGRRVGPLGVEEAGRGTADEVPSSGGGKRVYAGLVVADAHGPRRYRGARCREAGTAQSFVKAAQVRKARHEPEHVDTVGATCVELDRLVGPKAAQRCQPCEVGAELPGVRAASIAYGNDHGPKVLAARGPRVCQDALNSSSQLVEAR